LYTSIKAKKSATWRQFIINEADSAAKKQKLKLKLNENLKLGKNKNEN